MSDARSVHLQDQIEAATAQVSQGMQSLPLYMLISSSTRDGEETQALISRIPNGALWMVALHETRDVRGGCQHLGSPGPMAGLLAVPGRVWCMDCGVQAMEAWSLLHPDDCEGCGLPAPGGAFQELAVQFGPLLLWANVGVCCGT